MARFKLSSVTRDWISQQSMLTFDADIAQLMQEDDLSGWEAIWMLQWYSQIQEAPADDPFYSDESFNFSYRMPSGRMAPVELAWPAEPSPGSERPLDSTC